MKAKFADVITPKSPKAEKPLLNVSMAYDYDLHGDEAPLKALQKLLQ